MDELILFIFTFLFCFFGRFTLYLLSKRRKPKKAKKKKDDTGIAVEIKYLMVRFNLDEGRLDKRSFAALISFLDALIISGTMTLVVLISKSLVIEMILGLAIVIVLIILVNEILGRILIKKGYRKK